jgi:hypothetical protein
MHSQFEATLFYYAFNIVATNLIKIGALVYLLVWCGFG